MPESPTIFHRMGRWVLLTFIELHHAEPNNDCQKRQPVRVEASRQSKESQTKPREYRTNHARQLKLGRIQGNGIREVLASNQVKGHCLIGGPCQRHAASSDERKAKNHPDISS